MKWILAIPVFLLPLLTGFTGVQQSECGCSPITELARTAKTSGSISWSWNDSGEAAGYEVWYYREEGNYTSPRYYTTTGSFGFTGLPAGHYTFYFVVNCGGESSSIIGWEDLIGS